MARLVTLCAVFLLTLSAAAEAAAPASPAEVVRRFAAELNVPYEKARPCRWLSARVRPLVDSPYLTGADPWLTESYTPQLRRHGCDAWIALASGFSGGVADSDVARVRVAVERARFVARRGRSVHLRVSLFERFDGRPWTRRPTTDVFLLRERGRWRIVAMGRLWRPGLDAGPPRTLAELTRHLRWLRRAGRSVRAYERALIRAYLRTRTAVATTPLPLTGPMSSADDPLRDVERGWAGKRVGDQERPAVDLRGASLSTAGGEVAFELRFRQAVPREADIALHLMQLRGRPRTAILVDGRWRVSLRDGWASAWGGEDGLTAIAGLRASAVGDTLRLVGGAQLRDRSRRIDLSRRLIWSITATERVPGSPGLAQTWSDRIPDFVDPTEQQVEHPPPG